MGNWNHNYYVYILSNLYNTVIYTGMSNDLCKRIRQHKAKEIPGFTRRYNVTRLMYYEHFENVEDAIRREKQIKSGSRKKKVALIEIDNPAWQDLFYKLCR